MPNLQNLGMKTTDHFEWIKFQMTISQLLLDGIGLIFCLKAKKGAILLPNLDSTTRLFFE